MEFRAIVEAVKMAGGPCTVISDYEGIIKTAQQGKTPAFCKPLWDELYAATVGKGGERSRGRIPHGKAGAGGLGKERRMTLHWPVPGSVKPDKWAQLDDEQLAGLVRRRYDIEEVMTHRPFLIRMLESVNP